MYRSEAKMNNILTVPFKKITSATCTFYVEDNVIVQIWGKGISIRDFNSDIEYVLPWDDAIEYIKTHGIIIQGRSS